MPTLELRLTSGPSKNKVVSLDGRRSLTIGRAPTNDLVLPDEKVSSHHARLDIAPGGVILTDLGSKNGTYASGECIVGSRLLTPGMEVSMGASIFVVVEIEGADSEDSIYRSSGSNGSHGSHDRLNLSATRDLVLKPVTHAETIRVSKAQRNLATLMALGDLLACERDPDRFLERMLDLVFEIFPADRGCVMLLDKDGEPQSRAARWANHGDTGKITVSRTVLDNVLTTGVSVLTADAGTDENLAPGASVITLSIRSVMCAPIRGRENVLGAIYVDTMRTIGVFAKEDLEVMVTMGLMTGAGLENIKLYRENMQQERMAAIGKVVAGLGHDIRSMLTALRGGMYLLEDELNNHHDEETRKSWEIVQHGLHSIAELVKDMVNYTKSREPEWAQADINRVALAAAALVRARAQLKRVQVTELVDNTIEPFWFDPNAIERCVMNLLLNAVDAAPQDTGIVSVSTMVDDERDMVQVLVQDNGDGIPAEHRDKVFDLLYSTKGSRGTGFGLAITRKIIEEHGGTLSLRSDVDKGTVFTFELPLRTERPSGSQA